VKAYGDSKNEIWGTEKLLLDCLAELTMFVRRNYDYFQQQRTAEKEIFNLASS
jgi:hypothetical protein